MYNISGMRLFFANELPSELSRYKYSHITIANTAPQISEVTIKVYIYEETLAIIRKEVII